MSNAMRFGKRSLAAVAAGALAAGMISFVAAPTASATTTGSAVSASGVRVTYTGTATIATLDKVPYARLSWTTGAVLAANDTISVTLTGAPSDVADIAFATKANATPGTAVQAIDGGGADGFINELAFIGLQAGTPTPQVIGVPAFDVTAAGDTTWVGVAANTPGTYAGTINIYNNAGTTLKETVPFSFTTVGKPASITLSPASTTVPVAPAASTNADLAVALADAAGNRTQPTITDTIQIAAAPSASTTLTNSALTSAYLNAGAFPSIAFGSTAAGSYAITATPTGTMAGLTAQTSIVNVTGTISTTAITAAEVTAPADGITTGTGLNANTNYVPAGTSTVSVLVSAGAGNAGQTLRFQGISSAGSPTSTAPQYVNATLNSAGQATVTFTLGGAAISNGSTLTIQQVNSANSAGGLPYVAVQQQTRAVSGDYVVPTPDGNVVAKVGTSTNVTVDVTDQFYGPQAGWTVTAYRNTVAAANIVGSSATNADGTASLTMTPLATTAAGSSETYLFVATSPAGQIVASSYPLVILYTADGTVTNLSANIGVAGVTNPITTLTTSQPVIALATVPTDGTASGTTASTFTVASATVGNAVGIGDLIPVTFSTSPANAIALTASEGVKMTTLSSRAWNGGASTLTVSSGTTVNFFSTKTGLKVITAESGGKTIKINVIFTNQTTDYYNVAVSPAKQEITTDGFGRVTVTVTDVFGNPVDTTGGFGAAVTPLNVAATGNVLLGGLNNTATIGTSTDGKAEVVVIGAATPGVGKVTVTGASTGAWASSYTPPTGAPAPVKTGSADVAVVNASSKSIVISGERGTVSGKPGIKVDGVTEGIADGETVRPWVRFPGQTSYTEGSASPKIADGAFTWQRKTGKKTYVYFKHNEVKSNTVIIPAK